MQGKQTGLATVEMSIALLLLLLLLLSMAEFGRLFFQYNDLTKAVGSATRYLASNALNAAGAEEITAADSMVAKNLVLYGSPANTGSLRLQGLSADSIQITTTNGYVTLSVSWTYVTLLGGTIPTFGLGNEGSLDPAVTLYASLTMRVLN